MIKPTLYILGFIVWAFLACNPGESAEEWYTRVCSQYASIAFISITEANRYLAKELLDVDGKDSTEWLIVRTRVMVNIGVTGQCKK